MGIWNGTNPASAYTATPTSAYLGIWDPGTGRTLHPARPAFAVGEGAMPSYASPGELRLDSTEELLADGVEGDLRLMVWGDFEGAAKLSTLRSGDTTSTSAYSEVWRASGALLAFTSTRIAWVRGPAVDHPLAQSDRRLRKGLQRNMPGALAVGHVRFDWIKRMQIGTNNQGRPFVVVEALDQCAVDSPRPVRVVAWLVDADRPALVLLGEAWSEFVGRDIRDWVDDWSAMEVPGAARTLVNQRAEAPS